MVFTPVDKGNFWFVLCTAPLRFWLDCTWNCIVYI